MKNSFVMFIFSKEFSFKVDIFGVKVQLSSQCVIVYSSMTIQVFLRNKEWIHEQCMNVSRMLFERKKLS